MEAKLSVFFLYLPFYSSFDSYLPDYDYFFYAKFYLLKAKLSVVS